MREQFLGFLKSPGPETYLAARAELLESGQYDPYSVELIDVEKELEAGRFREAGRIVADSMPNLLLSPRAHLTLAFISSRLDDKRDAEGEGVIASLLADAIIATGKGTKEEPFLVLRSSDEYDVLQYLGKEGGKQSMVHEEDRHFDRFQFRDKTELWFDISDAYARLEEDMDGSASDAGSGEGAPGSES